jgi:hypothetical protein
MLYVNWQHFRGESAVLEFTTVKTDRQSILFFGVDVIHE